MAYVLLALVALFFAYKYSVAHLYYKLAEDDLRTLARRAFIELDGTRGKTEADTLHIQKVVAFLKSKI